MLDDGLRTASSEEQAGLEQRVARALQDHAGLPAVERAAGLALRRGEHEAYLRAGLAGLPRGYVALEAGRPWLAYWLLHSLALLGAPVDAPTSSGERWWSLLLVPCRSRRAGVLAVHLDLAALPAAQGRPPGPSLTWLCCLT